MTIQGTGTQDRNRSVTIQGIVHVFLADYFTIVREGLQMLLETQPDMRVVGSSGDGKVAFEQIQELQSSARGVDVLVIDVSLPEWNGIETTRQVKKQWPHIKVLALSMYEDKKYLLAFLEAGASGYILKRSNAAKLIRAIRTIIAGDIYLDPLLSAMITEALVQDVDGISNEKKMLLSKREEEMIRLIAQGFTNKEIAAQFFLSVKTVETYKARAQGKLGIESRSDLVHYAFSHGWIHPFPKQGSKPL